MKDRVPVLLYHWRRLNVMICVFMNLAWHFLNLKYIIYPNHDFTELQVKT